MRVLFLGLALGATGCSESAVLSMVYNCEDVIPDDGLGDAVYTIEACTDGDCQGISGEDIRRIGGEIDINGACGKGDEIHIRWVI